MMPAGVEQLSIVIPVCNESQSLPELHAEIRQVAERERLDIGIIFVDDGSTDGSWGVIADLARKDARVQGIRFRRNFGKAAGLTAGFKAARGDLVMTMDGDLQDDPAEIPRFLERIKGGLDVVSGWKKKRLDPWHKVYPSRVFNGLVGVLTGFVGVGGGFLYVPALTLLGGLAMKEAIGTSLVLILLGCSAGLVRYSGPLDLDWRAMALFTGIAFVGVAVGSRLAPYVSQQALKKGFAVFLLVMGALVLALGR